MTIERSRDFILVALFLSRCGRYVEGATPLPPKPLGTDSWAAAYAVFFDALAAGRSFRSFHNSLKAARDQFDSHVDSGRRGWWVDGEPRPLPTLDAEVLKLWDDRSDTELWEAVAQFADMTVADVPASVLADLEAEPEEGEERVSYGLEGKAKAVVSKVRERSPALRSAALNLYGFDCQVCEFNFEAVYGPWGRDFAEVHHLRDLSSVPEEGIHINPVTDLSVLCSNCHRMIHRKAKRAISLDELRKLMDEV